jgi:hypothetical protein
LRAPPNSNWLGFHHVIGLCGDSDAGGVSQAKELEKQLAMRLQRVVEKERTLSGRSAKFAKRLAAVEGKESAAAARELRLGEREAKLQVCPPAPRAWRVRTCAPSASASASVHVGGGGAGERARGRLCAAQAGVAAQGSRAGGADGEAGSAGSGGDGSARSAH